MTPPSVLLLDPSHQVPFYDAALAAALARVGAAVTLATSPLPYYEPPAPAPGVRVEECFGQTLGWLRAAGLHPAERPHLRRAGRAVGYPWELAGAIARASKRDDLVIHAQWSLAPRLDAAVWRALRRRGIPVVHTAHNVLPHEAWARVPTSDSRSIPAVARWRRLYASVDRLIVHSDATKRRLLALGGVGQEVVRVIPMAAEPGPSGGARAGASVGRADGAEAHEARAEGHATRAEDRASLVSAEHAEAGEIARKEARARLGLPADGSGGGHPPLALFFGHVRPYKGLDVLLDAWPMVASAVPGARLLVAGPAGHGVARALERDPRLDRLGDAVILRLGYVPTRDVADHFLAADVVVLPYLDTDDSAVLATALGHGRAVVASRVGGLPEALARGGGLLVPPGDTAALATALVSVLGDAGARERLEAEALAAAGATGWDEAARATLEVYDEARQERARAAATSRVGAE